MFCPTRPFLVVKNWEFGPWNGSNLFQYEKYLLWDHLLKCTVQCYLIWIQHNIELYRSTPPPKTLQHNKATVHKQTNTFTAYTEDFMSIWKMCDGLRNMRGINPYKTLPQITTLNKCTTQAHYIIHIYHGCRNHFHLTISCRTWFINATIKNCLSLCYSWANWEVFVVLNERYRALLIHIYKTLMQSLFSSNADGTQTRFLMTGARPQ